MKITAVHYRDMQGTLITIGPMTTNRLWAIKQTVSIGGRSLSIERVAVADGIQHVNVAPPSRQTTPTSNDIGAAFDILFGVRR